MIRNALVSDAAACAALYNYYITETTVTFETSPMTEEDFAERITGVSRFFPFFVWEDERDGAVLGYAYLSPFSPRGAYRFTCDLSIYVERNARGRGIGHALLSAITEAAKKQGFHTMISVITSQNEPSMRFHAREGFVHTASIDGIAYKKGQWLGIRYYRLQLLPENGDVPPEPVPYPAAAEI